MRENRNEIAPNHTPANPFEVAGVFTKAWWLTQGDNVPPLKASICLLLAHSALETGRWRHMMNYNFGGEKATSGDVLHTYLPTHEHLLPGYVAKQQEESGEAHSYNDETGWTPLGHPDIMIEGRDPSGLLHIKAWPFNPICRFRAYSSLQQGALAQFLLLKKRYAKAWVPLVYGDAVAFCQALKNQHYFTDELELYAKSIVSLQKEYSSLPFNPIAIIDSIHPSRDEILATIFLTNDHLLDSLMRQSNNLPLR